MFKKILTLSLTSGLLLTACGDQTDLETLEQEAAGEAASLQRASPEHTSLAASALQSELQPDARLEIETEFLSDAYDIPSADELIEDSRYMRSINEGKGSDQLPIDHSDPLQHRFVLHRLARAGMTPETAPNLHREVQRLRVEALQRRANGEEPLSTASTTYNHFHAFDTTQPASPIGYGVVSYSTETSKLVVDETLYEIINGAWYERGYSRKNVLNNKTLSVGSTLYSGETLQGGTILGESYAIQTSPSGVTNESYSYDESDGFESPAGLTVVPSQENAVSTSDSLVLEHPKDHNSDDVTKVCTDRQSIADCDYYGDLANQQYYVHGTPYPATIQEFHVYIATKGTAKFETLSSISEMDKDCDGISDASGQDTARSSECIHLMLQNIGSCEPNSSLSLDGIWAIDPLYQNRVKLDTINMNWRQDGSLGDPIDMDTGSGCTAQNAADATLWVEAKVRGKDNNGVNNRSKTAGLCMGANTNTGPTACLNYGSANGSMKVVKSCVAEGSLVRLASGRQVPIEQVQVGDRVLSDEAGRTLTVMDRTVGIETTSMIRVVDSNGHSLLVTETHAIPTLNRGIVAAGALNLDDVLLTEQGIATLTELRAEPFDGGVFNLTLGAEHELPRLHREDTTMLVNGILVGDQRMQNWLGDRLLEEADPSEASTEEW